MRKVTQNKIGRGQQMTQNLRMWTTNQNNELQINDNYIIVYRKN